MPFTVIGVLAERGQGLDLSNEDNQVYVPLSTAMHRLMKVDYYNAIVVEVETVNAMDNAAEELRSLLRTRHRLRPGQPDDFQVQNQRLLLETRRVATSRLEFFLRWIGASALMVSGLGILSITWIGFKEGTRGIGTCRALGATATDIFFQTFFQSATLALAGGCLGLAVAWPVTRVINYSAGLPFVFEAKPAAVAFIAAAILNLAFSLLPSRKAASLNPIEALRHE